MLPAAGGLVTTGAADTGASNREEAVGGHRGGYAPAFSRIAAIAV